jgi:hypothetical protein
MNTHLAKVANRNYHAATPNTIQFPGQSSHQTICAAEGLEMQATYFINDMAFRCM